MGTLATMLPGRRGGQALILILSSCYPLPSIKGLWFLRAPENIRDRSLDTEPPRATDHTCIAHVAIQGDSKGTRVERMARPMLLTLFSVVVLESNTHQQGLAIYALPKMNETACRRKTGVIKHEAKRLLPVSL